MRWIDGIVARHHQAGLVLDTNVLLLYIVGRVDETQISRVKRISQFTMEDARWARDFAARFHTVWTTPHIVAEFSNLTEKLDREFRDGLWQGLSDWVSDSNTVRESRKEFRLLSRLEGYLPFGTTDAAVMALAMRNKLVLTVDATLAAFLEDLSLPVLNYNRVRQETFGLHEP